ncbi:ABC transporter substrate-binding protein [Candidatus Falkowbacteria bacterium]|nr:ABC transporter substrate-binding protein [Candidatus Falkowbacteria bacterium]
MFKNSKTILWLVIAIITVAGVSYGLSRNSTSPEKQELIKIGVIISLTGKGADRGESAMQGLNLALKKINDRELLGDKELKLILEDAPIIGGGEKAISAFNKLTAIDKVTAIIGPMGSPTAVPVAPIVDATKTPTIVHTASAKKVTENNEYVFRLWTTSRNYVDAILPQIQKNSYKKIAAITAQADNTIDQLNILKQEIDTIGASFVLDEKASAEETDFHTQLAKLKQTDADALFINLHEGQIGLIGRQIKELGLEIPIFTNSVMSQVEIEVSSGEGLEGVWYPRFAGYDNKAKQDFISEYGEEPTNPETAAAAHDALLILAQAISQSGTNGEKIKDYIYSHTFDVSIGQLKFRENGDAILPLKIKTVKDGKIVDLVE